MVAFATRSSRTALAVLAAGTLLLTGCAGSPGANGSTTTAAPSSPAASPSATASPSESPRATASPSPKPVPASADGPAKNWPVPKMPKEAKEKTAQGVKAFAEYYFELMEYTTWTLDSKPIKAVTTRDCELCGDGVIDPADRNRAAGTWVAGGDYDPEIGLVQIINGDSAAASFSFEQTKTVTYNSDGGIYSTVPATDHPAIGAFSFVYEGGWKVTSISLES